jgi:hypothetical protein
MTCRLRTALLIAAVVVLLGSAPAAAPRSKPCYPKRSRTLLANREARVFALRPGLASRGYDIYGCAFASGDRYSLEGPPEVIAFTPPAISLAGPLVGFAVNACDIESCSTGVFVKDLRLAGTSRSVEEVVRHVASPTGQDVVKVGSLRITRGGAIAWIVCPDTYGGVGDPPTRRNPNCVRPGSLDRVVALPGGSSEVVVLDKGREIDPSSLRLAGHRLSWRHSGRIRHASLS